MDVSALQIYVEVVRQGSFAAVARTRNVDPSSISRAVAALETELGIRLLQRTTRKLALTEAGAQYFERLAPLLEELQQASDIATDISGQPKGTLRVTTSTSFGQQWVVPLLPEFQATYPHLTLDLLLTDTVVDFFAERIDLAIRLGLMRDSELIAERLRKTRYLVCASPSYLRQSETSLEHPGDIERHNCLLFPLAGFRSRWQFRNKTGDTCAVDVRGRTLISNASSLRQCAIAGMGLALLADWLVERDLHSGILVEVFPEFEVTATDFNTAVWLVYPSRAYIPRKVRVFVEFLRAHKAPN